MKKKVILFSIVLLIILLTGTTLAWFSSADSKINTFKTGTVELEILEPGFTDIDDVQLGTYDKNIKIKNTGTGTTYVRVRLIPQWSEPSLPISNVQLNLDNDDWLLHTDGYYYFKYYLKSGQDTSLLLNSVTFTDLGPEYENKTFTIKVVAEGVQASNGAWRDVWGLTELPFKGDRQWKP